MFTLNSHKTASTFEDRNLIPTVRPRLLLRKMWGGSQSILMRCSDDKVYIVKLNGNPQGPNLLANEFIGAQLMQAAGLLTPPATSIAISEEFIGKNPGLHFETSTGSIKPGVGFHFASRFIGATPDLRANEPASLQFQTIVNRDDMVGIYVFDVWANLTDRREAIFYRQSRQRMHRACFIDNGHLFGGPHWQEFTQRNMSTGMNEGCQPSSFDPASLHRWCRRLRLKLPSALEKTVSDTPASWYRGDISALYNTLSERLEDLEDLIRDRPFHPEFQFSIT